MLDFMRRNARSTGIKIALGAIVVVFIFFMGGGGQIGVGPTALATVGDIEITGQEYMLAQNRNESYFRQQFGGQLNPQMLKALDIPSMTLRQLIDGAVLRAEAERLGLSVPDEAVRDSLRRVSAFQSNGTFSPGLYRETLRSQGLSPGSFEESVRQDLLEAQLADIIRRGSHVSEDEAWASFQRENRKMTLSYIAVDSTPFESAVTVNEEELTKFFEGKQESYRNPASVKVRYIAYKVADAAAKVTVSDVDLNEYYDLNKNVEFQNEEQVGARHILKKVAKDADEETKKAARTAIEAVAARLAAGEDFATVATAESEDPGSAVKGGDLGLFGRGRMVPPFDAAAFALEKGKVSDIVETDFGFHIILVYEKRPAGTSSFEEVKDKIQQTLAKQKAVDQVFDDAAADAATIGEGTSFDSVATTRGAKIEETPLFSQGDVVPGIGAAPAFVEAALALANPGDASQPVKVGEDYYLLTLAEKKDSFIPPMAEVRKKVEEDFRKQAAIELARKRADELLASAKTGMKLADLATQDGLTVAKAEDVTADSKFVVGVGAVPGLADVAFQTTADGEVLARTFVSGNKAFVFVRDAVVDAERAAFDEAKEETMKKLEGEREQAALADFIAALKTKAEITYNAAQLKPLLGESAPEM